MSSEIKVSRFIHLGLSEQLTEESLLIEKKFNTSAQDLYHENYSLEARLALVMELPETLFNLPIISHPTLDSWSIAYRCDRTPNVAKVIEADKAHYRNNMNEFWCILSMVAKGFTLLKQKNMSHVNIGLEDLHIVDGTFLLGNIDRSEDFYPIIIRDKRKFYAWERQEVDSTAQPDHTYTVRLGCIAWALFTGNASDWDFKHPYPYNMPSFDMARWSIPFDAPKRISQFIQLCWRPGSNLLSAQIFLISGQIEDNSLPNTIYGLFQKSKTSEEESCKAVGEDEFKRLLSHDEKEYLNEAFNHVDVPGTGDKKNTNQDRSNIYEENESVPTSPMDSISYAAAPKWCTFHAMLMSSKIHSYYQNLKNTAQGELPVDFLDFIFLTPSQNYNTILQSLLRLFMYSEFPNKIESPFDKDIFRELYTRIRASSFSEKQQFSQVMEQAKALSVSYEWISTLDAFKAYFDDITGSSQSNYLDSYDRASKDGILFFTNILADCYMKGYGAKQDVQKAVSLYSEAAPYSPRSNTRLAEHYMSAGPHMNLEKADFHLNAAVYHADPCAFYLKAIRYKYASSFLASTQIDDLERSVFSGNPLHQELYGRCIHSNPKYRLDKRIRGIELLRLAALQNYYDAQCRLIVIFEKGETIPKDPVLGKMWKSYIQTFPSYTDTDLSHIRGILPTKKTDAGQSLAESFWASIKGGSLEKLPLLVDLASGGDLHASYYLAMYYLTMTNIAPKQVEALAMLKRCAEGLHQLAMSELLAHYPSVSQFLTEDEKIHYLEFFADKGDPNCQLMAAESALLRNDLDVTKCFIWIIGIEKTYQVKARRLFVQHFDKLEAASRSWDDRNLVVKFHELGSAVGNPVSSFRYLKVLLEDNRFQMVFQQENIIHWRNFITNYKLEHEKTYQFLLNNYKKLKHTVPAHLSSEFILFCAKNGVIFGLIDWVKSKPIDEIHELDALHESLISLMNHIDSNTDFMNPSVYNSYKDSVGRHRIPPRFLETIRKFNITEAKIDLAEILFEDNLALDAIKLMSEGYIFGCKNIGLLVSKHTDKFKYPTLEKLETGELVVLALNIYPFTTTDISSAIVDLLNQRKVMAVNPLMPAYSDNLTKLYELYEIKLFYDKRSMNRGHEPTSTSQLVTQSNIKQKTILIRDVPPKVIESIVISSKGDSTLSENDLIQSIGMCEQSPLRKWRIIRLGLSLSYSRVVIYFMQNYTRLVENLNLESEEFKWYIDRHDYSWVVKGVELSDLYKVGALFRIPTALFYQGVSLCTGNFVCFDLEKSLKSLYESHKLGISMSSQNLAKYFEKFYKQLSPSDLQIYLQHLVATGDPFACCLHADMLMQKHVTGDTCCKILDMFSLCLEIHNHNESVLQRLLKYGVKIFYCLPKEKYPFFRRLIRIHLSKILPEKIESVLANTEDEAHLVNAFPFMYCLTEEYKRYVDIISMNFEKLYQSLGLVPKILLLELPILSTKPEVLIRLAWHYHHGIGALPSKERAEECLRRISSPLLRIVEVDFNTSDIKSFIDQFSDVLHEISTQEGKQGDKIAADGKFNRKERLSSSLYDISFDKSQVTPSKSQHTVQVSNSKLFGTSESLLYGREDKQRCFEAISILIELVQRDYKPAISTLKEIENEEKGLVKLMLAYSKRDYPDAYRIARLWTEFKSLNPMVLMTLWAIYQEAPILLSENEGINQACDALVKKIRFCTSQSFSLCERFYQETSRYEKSNDNYISRVNTVYALMVIHSPSNGKLLLSTLDYGKILLDNAERGEPFSKYILYTLWLSDYGIIQQDLAHRYLEEAANKNIAMAVYECCVVYRSNENFMRNSLDLCMKAAKLGHEGAMYDCALLGLSGSGELEGYHVYNEKCVRYGLLLSECNFSEWMEISAQKRHVPACCYLAMSKINDANVENRRKGYEYIKYIVDNGKEEYLFEQAQCLAKGLGTGRDIERSVQILEQLQRKGDTAAGQHMEVMKTDPYFPYLNIINHLVNNRYVEASQSLERLSKTTQNLLFSAVVQMILIEAHPQYANGNPHQFLEALREKARLMNRGDKIWMKRLLDDLMKEDSEALSPFAMIACVLKVEHLVWVESDIEEAKTLFDALRRKIHPLVDFKIGYFFTEICKEKGMNQTLSLDLIEHFENAARDGHCLAKVYHGSLLSRSPDAEKQKKGANALKEVIDYQFPLAHFILSEAYFMGRGVQQDFLQSYQLFVKGKEIDVRLVQYKKLVDGNIYLRLFAVGLHYFSVGNMKEAQKHLQLSLDYKSRFIPSLIALRQMYYQSPSLFLVENQKEETGLDRDALREIEMQLAQVSKADVVSCRGIFSDFPRKHLDRKFMAYLWTVEYDFHKQFDRTMTPNIGGLKKAIQEGCLPAAYILGDVLASGQSLDPDSEDPKNCFRRAGEGGHIFAKYRLALLLVDRSDVNQSTMAMGHDLLMDSGKNGNPYAAFKLAKLVASASPTNSVELYRQSALMGHFEAKLQYMTCLEKGIGLSKDEAKAFAWAKTIATLDEPLGWYHYARFLHHGVGCRQDIRTAVQYYHKSALSAGITGAFTALADLYQSGATDGIDIDLLLRKLQRGDEHSTEAGDLVSRFRLLKV